jgi:hypothetical protein
MGRTRRQAVGVVSTMERLRADDINQKTLSMLTDTTTVVRFETGRLPTMALKLMIRQPLFVVES